MSLLTHMKDIFSTTLVQQEFASRISETGFNRTTNWIELAVVLSVMILMSFISKFLISKGCFTWIKQLGFRHIAERILWPVLMLMVGIVAIVVWQFVYMDALWIRLLVLAANWMILIRIVLALLNLALPAGSWFNRVEISASSILWGYFVMWVSGVDDFIIHWMKSIQFTVGSNQLNLLMIATGLFWVGLVMLGMMWLAKLINNRVMANNNMDINLRIVLSKVVTTILLFLSVLIALPLVGINLSVLSVFGGALGVGLGFGLQKIASNYVSGFIILADRSVRPGDRLVVNGFTGYVTKITARFVVLRSGTGQEALIPNETFVTSTVINESYTVKSLYQSLDVQVAYSADLDLAMKLMREAAAEQERIETTPAPSASLIGFGDNGVNLRIGFWVKDPENGFGGLFSAVLMGIWRRFNESGIEFPFPQREVRILNADETKSGSVILSEKNT